MRAVPLFTAVLSAISLVTARQCATHIDPSVLLKVEASFELDLGGVVLLPPRCKTVDVNFNVIYANKTLSGGYVPHDQVYAQMEVLNKGFENTPYYFHLNDIKYVDNEEWFNGVDPSTDEGTAIQSEMKAKLRKGNEGTLNIYTVGFPNVGLLGYATFPSTLEDKTVPLSDDGVVVRYSSLPGGTIVPYNLGMTTTHEVGHWVGLYHTFQGGEDCAGKGDFVDDTPAQAEPTSGCPKDNVQDTCPQPGFDPIHNYMDYSDDGCMTEFTKGQIRRMTGQMSKYRHI